MAKEALSPVAIPDQHQAQRQVWAALANAAQALLEAARAMQGDVVYNPVSTHAPTLTPHNPAPGCTVLEAVNDFLISKARAERSDRYLRALKNSLGKFCRGRSRQPLASVTCAEIEEWLHGQGWKGRTQKGYLGDVKTLFAFAIRRGYLSGANPAAGVECAAMSQTAPGIHTPEQVAAILELARGFDLDVCRSLAVRYFSGLRASEAESLQESEIKVAQGVIEVTAAKAKTRRRRLVTITPALGAWLALGGSLPLRSVSKRTRAFLSRVRAAGLPWPANAPRHSFCSYHLAAFENAGKTALEAGHSEQMLFAHYRAVVTKGEAERFWAIRPVFTPVQSTSAPNQNAP